MNKQKIKSFIAKLKDIRSAAYKLQPDTYSRGYRNNPYWEDITLVDIHSEFDRLKAVLRRFGLDAEIKRVDDILDDNKENFLFAIQDPPPWEGELLVLRELIDLIDSIIFAYSDADDIDQKQSSSYFNLISILKGLERAFTITQKYPCGEDDVHLLSETILICSFPKLIHKPTIQQQVKSYEADTGIPETKSLIEYKFIDNKKKVPLTADQLFGDAIGYTDVKWNNLICVIYETERFCTEEAWKEEMKKVPRAEVVLIRGTKNMTNKSLKRVTAKGRRIS